MVNQQNFKVSVVLPAYNEEDNLEPLLDKLLPVLSNYHDFEVIFVNDGSSDRTLEKLTDISKKNKKIKFISLSRNFGHQNALKAGLDNSSGDCIISMDCDLQHPPELIPKFIELWNKGYKVVYTIRNEQINLPFFKKLTSKYFYKFMNLMSNTKIENGAADFRLIDKEVKDILKSINETPIFLRGLISWMGFKQTSFNYDPHQRFAGQTKYTYKKMINFAINGLSSFSVKPLTLATYIGVLATGLALVFAIYSFYQYLIGVTVQGWTSILISILTLGGIQLIILGVIGQYLGKTYLEGKNRPQYIIEDSNIRQNGQSE